MLAMLFLSSMLRPLEAAVFTVTIPVDIPGPGTLRQAISDALASPGPDTIEFDALLTGITMPLGAALPLWVQELTIDGADRNITFTGQSILVSEGATIELIGLTISGATGSNGGGINNDGSLTLTECTLSDNTADDGGAIYNSGTLEITDSTLTDNEADHGGGIFNVGGATTVTNSTVNNNEADTGGGIYSFGGTVTLANTRVKENTASEIGGGIHNIDGTMKVTDNSFITSNDADEGGGIYTSGGELHVTDSSVSSNNANRTLDDALGGGIFNSNATVRLTNSYVSGNNAHSALSGTSMGGGIYSWDGFLIVRGGSIDNNSATCGGLICSRAGGISSNSLTSLTRTRLSNNRADRTGGLLVFADKATINRSTISGNTSDSDGAGIMNGGTLNIHNSTISSNVVDSSGGGILNSWEGELTIVNSTITANVATSYGGGIFGSPGGTVVITNSILAGNNATSGNDCDAEVTSTGRNLVGTEIGCAISGFIYVGDPLLGPLAENGGPTPTHALLTDSPAIDVGDDGVCAAEPILGWDQREVSRPQGDQCDLGAFEKEVIRFSVTPSVGASGGTITPSTAQQVVSGESTQFLLIPDDNHHIESVGGTCGGSRDGDVYTTNAIFGDCTVVANFAIDTYTVSPSALGGGSISPANDQEVEYNTQAQFSLTPDPGFRIDQVGGTCGGTLDGNIYTTNTITGSCTVVAQFAKLPGSIFANGFEPE